MNMVDEEEGNRELLGMPMVSADVRDVVMAGFTTEDDKLSAQKPLGAVRAITKQQVIAAFGHLHFSSDGWNKALATPPDWLKPCRIARGRRGDKIATATWNPALIAVALFDKHISISKLDAVFVGLADWADEWREKSATFRK